MAWTDFLPMAGQVLDHFLGNKARKDSPKLAGQTAYQENMQGILGRLEAAKASGIHPALALGGSISSSGAPMPVGSDFRGAFTDMTNLAMQRRELQMRDEEKRFSREQQEYENSVRRAQLELDLQDRNLKNELTRTQIEAARKSMTDSDRDFAASQAELVRRQSMHTPGVVSRPALGTRENPYEQYVWAKAPNGELIRIPNSQAGYDLETPDTLSAGTLIWPYLKKMWREDAPAREKDIRRLKSFWYEKIRGMPHNLEND